MIKKLPYEIAEQKLKEWFEKTYPMETFLNAWAVKGRPGHFIVRAIKKPSLIEKIKGLLKRAKVLPTVYYKNVYFVEENVYEGNRLVSPYRVWISYMRNKMFME